MKVPVFLHWHRFKHRKLWLCGVLQHSSKSTILLVTVKSKMAHLLSPVTYITSSHDPALYSINTCLFHYLIKFKGIAQWNPAIVILLFATMPYSCKDPYNKIIEKLFNQSPLSNNNLSKHPNDCKIRTPFPKSHALMKLLISFTLHKYFHKNVMQP